jgi:hypothetical protein
MSSLWKTGSRAKLNTFTPFRIINLVVFERYIMIYSTEVKGRFGYMTSDDYMTILYINIATCIHAHTHARPQGPQSLGPLSGLYIQ